MNYICDYLKNADWEMCPNTMCFIDPVTGTRYTSSTEAYIVQLSRDLNTR
jgi:hypothetical protein